MSKWKLILVVGCVVLGLATVACGGDGDDGADDGEATAGVTGTRPSGTDEPSGTSEPSGTEEPSGTGEPSATEPASGTPQATNTRRPVLNPSATGVTAIIAAARSNNATELEALVKYGPVPCVPEPQGLGGPPVCREGEASPVDAVFATECEGYFARPGELNFDQITFGAASGGDALFGVYEIDPASQLARIEEWAGAQYAIVLNRTGPGGRAAVYAIISDGELIVGVAAGCGETPEGWVEFQGLGAPVQVP
jgi:hypothetical protein